MSPQGRQRLRCFLCYSVYIAFSDISHIINERFRRSRSASGQEEKEKEMITSKQRSYLRGLAHELAPAVYIGKSGITENIVKEMETGLEMRELVKVKLQESCELEPKDAANELADLLKAEYVQAIGRRFTLYRESKEHKQIELPR